MITVQFSFFIPTVHLSQFLTTVHLSQLLNNCPFFTIQNKCPFVIIPQQLSIWHNSITLSICHNLMKLYVSNYPSLCWFVCHFYNNHHINHVISEFLEWTLPFLHLARTIVPNRGLSHKSKQNDKQCGYRWDGSWWASSCWSTLFAKVSIFVYRIETVEDCTDQILPR